MSISTEARIIAPSKTASEYTATKPLQELVEPAARQIGRGLPLPANETDRRKDIRETTLYRPCCIENGTRAQIGLIRNWSESGAQMESSLNVVPGDVIRYFWDGLPAVEGTVIWTKDGRIGVEHHERVSVVAAKFPARTVRIPCGQSVRIWAGETETHCLLANISLTGIQIFGVAPADAGSLVTIEICGRLFTSCTVRWCDHGSMGLKFNQSIRASELAALLDKFDEDN